MLENQRGITLVIPTLNEIEGLKAMIPCIDRALFNQVIVVDGHSTDGTIEYCRDQGLTVLIQPGKGIPDAETHAFMHSFGDSLILFTPDGNSLPNLLPLLCEKIEEGYDIVVASRYLGGAKSDDDDFFTAIGNKAFTFIVNILFKANYTDVLVGLRAYRREAIVKMNLHRITLESRLRSRFFYMNSWELGSSVRAARLKLRVLEIPGDEPKRIGGKRKLSILKNGIGAVMQILSDFFYYHGHDEKPS
jgi:glycosyltransferase involved in cell wall biosynthesis